MPRDIEAKVEYTNETAVRGQAMLELIKTYIPGLAGRYFGFRPLGSTDINFPAIFVEPHVVGADMVGLGRMELTWRYDLYWFVLGMDSGDTAMLNASIGEALIKLFSNNALSDIGQPGGNSGKFKVYDTFWEEAQIEGSVELSSPRPNPTKQAANFMRAGVMRLIIKDTVVK